MAANRFGIRGLKIDGEVFNVIGNVNYDLGGEMKEGVVGATGVDGFTVKHGIPFAEFEIRDRGDLSLQALKALENSTIVFELMNGKLISLYNAWAAGTWEGNSEEGNIQGRFEALRAEEIPAATV